MPLLLMWLLMWPWKSDLRVYHSAVLLDGQESELRVECPRTLRFKEVRVLCSEPCGIILERKSTGVLIIDWAGPDRHFRNLCEDARFTKQKQLKFKKGDYLRVRIRPTLTGLVQALMIAE